MATGFPGSDKPSIAEIHASQTRSDWLLVLAARFQA
jgi:hypothetical protein